MPKRRERSTSQEEVLKHPSTKRAKEIDADPPLGILLQHMDKQKGSTTTRNVLHWFRSKDLRAEDNRGLSAASAKAREGSGSLLACFLWSPKDIAWHGTSPARTDFMLESLRLLQEQLHSLNIPLVILTAESREEKGQKVLNLIKKHDISDVFANVEYEVDELRRDIDMFEKLKEDKSEVSFQLLHDQTVVEPGAIKSGSGGPLKVFTPYHKAWLAKVADEPKLLDLVDPPAANDKKTHKEFKDLFNTKIPSLPDASKFASDEDRTHIRKLWPAGHKAGLNRLQDFLDNKVKTYKTNRSIPATDNSSRLSPYFASGVISVREALKAARDANDGDGFDSGDAGIASWVREVVFREFYRQTLTHTPHDAMNMPHNLKFDFVQWEDDEEGWKKWCEGRTGMPFIDAGMRQLRSEAYMHNRLRMNTSSYLRTNLLIDYRKGERFFAENLVDWDLSNNTQGWEPSYTVFNPVVQAEKCDPHGDYIRKWVPELKNVEGKAIFDPFNRMSKTDFEKLGYPAPHVDFRESKDRCMQRYKQDMADADP
ncbi:deoxyribodipyrimidine photo-lyase [Cryphonectria parasitica EP155]|uniref:Deoxyribodipyrimidine photo-lyase n=1 Tax=Cryphonectria parasitica (strain ATCC 38755 / EP155) TaxID=660469 RepID=A0A9P5CH99_CRYP1|nr:deoxyribodipyrimidine photo-lyase [Cryphonectria parasitica EP155]KAF3760039.1 deoxyribodipyrimidine photo-lyase [Cryphonectria parasitica EP155]